ncbi:MAG: carboxypeptidase-like regulatory domain-containing protein [Planctomycetota bacterium]
MRNRVVIGVVFCLLMAGAAGLWLRFRGAERPVVEDSSADLARGPERPAAGEGGEGSPPKESSTGLRAPAPAGKLFIAGRVLNHDGTAAAGCLVQVRSTRSVADIFMNGVETGSDGAFRFDGLPASTGILSAGDALRFPASVVTLPFDLSDGRSRDGLELRLPQARIITVTVVDARGAAVAGAQVVVSSERANDDPKQGCVPTNELGVARLTSYGDFPVVEVVETPAFGRRYVLPMQTQLYPDDGNDVRFVLEDAGIASGVVLTPRGRPFKGGVVATLRGKDTVSTAKTDAEGRFEATVPEGETVTLAIDFGEKAPALQEAEDTWPVRVTGSLPGVSAGARDLVLQLQVQPLDRTLRVKVESPTGGPVAAAAVRLYEVYESPASARVTDQLGVAAFTGLPPVKLLVEVSPPDDDPAAIDWVKGLVRNVEPQGQELVVRLRAGFRIAGVVLKPDGEPCAGASVCTLIKRPDSGIVVVGADGRFSLLFDSEDVDRLDLVAWGEVDGEKLSAELRVRDRSVQNVTVRLEAEK